MTARPYNAQLMLVARITDMAAGVQHDRAKQKKNTIVLYFSGSDLVSWVLTNTSAINRNEARRVCQELIDAGFLCPCDNDGQINPSVETAAHPPTLVDEDTTFYGVAKSKREEVIGVFYRPNGKSSNRERAGSMKAGRKPGAAKSHHGRSKSGKDTKDPGGVFGVPLEILLRREGRPVPSILISTLTFIEKTAMTTTGIFRVEPNSVELARLKDIMDDLIPSQSQLIDFAIFDFKYPHIICALAKAFIRELPTPLLHPFENFISVADEPKPEKQIELLRGLVEGLPRDYSVTLDYLIGFLRRAVMHQDTTKMTASNLASVFAPNFLRRDDLQMEHMLKDAQNGNAITVLLIEHYETIFQTVEFMDDFKASLLELDENVPRTPLEPRVFGTPETPTRSHGSPTQRDSPRFGSPRSGGVRGFRKRPKSAPRPLLSPIKKSKEVEEEDNGNSPKDASAEGTMIDGTSIRQLLMAMTDASSGVPVKSRKHHLKTYKSVAIGSQIVDWLVEYYGNSRQSATEQATKLVEAGYLVSASQPPVPFKDSYLFYRFLVNDIAIDPAELPVDFRHLLEKELKFREYFAMFLSRESRALPWLELYELITLPRQGTKDDLAKASKIVEYIKSSSAKQGLNNEFSQRTVKALEEKIASGSFSDTMFNQVLDEVESHLDALYSQFKNWAQTSRSGGKSKHEEPASDEDGPPPPSYIPAPPRGIEPEIMESVLDVDDGSPPSVKKPTDSPKTMVRASSDPSIQTSSTESPQRATTHLKCSTAIGSPSTPTTSITTTQTVTTSTPTSTTSTNTNTTTSLRGKATITLTVATTTSMTTSPSYDGGSLPSSPTKLTPKNQPSSPENGNVVDLDPTESTKSKRKSRGFKKTHRFLSD